MENKNDSEGDLNLFGQRLEKVLQGKKMEIEDLADIYPVSDEDVRKNLYELAKPTGEFVELLVEKLKINADQRKSLLANLEVSYLKKSA